MNVRVLITSNSTLSIFHKTIPTAKYNYKPPQLFKHTPPLILYRTLIFTWCDFCLSGLEKWLCPLQCTHNIHLTESLKYAHTLFKSLSSTFYKWTGPSQLSPIVSRLFTTLMTINECVKISLIRGGRKVQLNLFSLSPMRF